MRALEIFRQLAGCWKFKRHIINQLDKKFSGTVIGEVNFTTINSSEYLYKEEGIFATEQGKFPITKTHLYLYNKITHTIDVHTTDSPQNKLFSLSFTDTNNPQAQHLCVADTYKARFLFPATNVFHTFTIDYEVSGPRKDYSSTTTFTRAIPF